MLVRFRTGLLRYFAQSKGVLACRLCLVLRGAQWPAVPEQPEDAQHEPRASSPHLLVWNLENERIA